MGTSKDRREYLKKLTQRWLTWLRALQTRGGGRQLRVEGCKQEKQGRDKVPRGSESSGERAYLDNRPPDGGQEQKMKGCLSKVQEQDFGSVEKKGFTSVTSGFGPYLT
jgi:hypothetical protein